jgi:hypothetical protein
MTLLTGLEDEVGDHVRVGDHRDVRRRDLNGGRVGSLRHESLRCGRDGVIVARHEIPRRNRLPRGLTGRLAQRRSVNRALCSRHDCRGVGGNVAAEHISEGAGSDVHVNAAGIGAERQVRWRGLAAGVHRQDLTDGLSLIGGERRDVDECLDVRVSGSGICDQNAAVGMTNEHDWP